MTRRVLIAPLLWCLLFLYGFTWGAHHSIEKSEYEGKLLKGNRNAIFLVQKGQRKQFPDFYTFSKLGYDAANIQKIADDVLNSIPLGDQITPIPVFRPEDYMYHSQCEDLDRMVRFSLTYTNCIVHFCLSCHAENILISHIHIFR